jgi:hypothetical protein
MVSLRTREGEQCVPFAAQSGQRWKTRLISVCLPTPHVTVTVFRSRPLARRSNAGNDNSSKGRDMQTIKTAILDVAFEAGGPRGGPPILLLHGWPDDIREW